MTDVSQIPPEEVSEETLAERPNGGPPKPQPTLGRRLKALRTSRDLSLKEVAARTGVSASFLSMIETGRNEMSVGRLVTMADFYGVGLTDLVPERDMEEPVILRHDDRHAVDSPDHLVTTETLASWHHSDMTSRFLRFEVGGEAQEVSPHPGPEFVLVLAGELTIEFADESSVALQEGDSIWFEGSRRHRYRNSDEQELRIITFQGGKRISQG